MRLWWQLIAHWLAETPARTALAALTIAAGVALGVAVDTINTTAVAEMRRAANMFSGRADLIVTGPLVGFDETLYPRLAREPYIEAINPIVEADVRVKEGTARIAVIGIDALRTAPVAPALLGTPFESIAANVLVTPDAAFLNAQAEKLLSPKRGERFTLPTANGDESFLFAGELTEFDAGYPVMVIDIALAQQRFSRLGKLSRLELRLAEGVTPDDARTRLRNVIPAALNIEAPDDQATRIDRLSRSYRVNLTVLALVALFTGAFVVLSTQALAVARRGRELALLATLGMTHGERLMLVCGAALLLGTTAAIAGVLVGLALAQIALSAFGGDLGTGVVTSASQGLTVGWQRVLGIALLGLLAALIGAWLPARSALSVPIAQQLKEQDQQWQAIANFHPYVGLALIAAGAVMTRLPPLGNLPWFGYASIAAMLVGIIMLLPVLSQWFTQRVRGRSGLTNMLVQQRIAHQPAFLSASVAGVVVSVALASAMLVMVFSFRQSLDHWLSHVLAGDLYVRITRSNVAHPEHRLPQALNQLQGVARTEWFRFERVVIDPKQPAVTVIARTLDEFSAKAVNLQRATCDNRARVPIWVSEAMPVLHGMAPGANVEFPLGSTIVRASVCGVYRDYGRQFGAITMGRADYIAASGDAGANDVALTLAPGADSAGIKMEIRQAAGDAGAVEITEAAEIRDRSLKVFDRTFAVTYALQAAAILIALAGIASGFAALAHYRRQEFALLAHLGFTRGAILKLSCLEGAAIAGFATLIGMLTGFAISLILIYVVNRQSFHWGMEVSLPWWRLMITGIITVLLATLCVALASRGSIRANAAQLLRAAE